MTFARSQYEGLEQSLARTGDSGVVIDADGRVALWNRAAWANRHDLV